MQEITILMAISSLSIGYSSARIYGVIAIGIPASNTDMAKTLPPFESLKYTKNNKGIIKSFKVINAIICLYFILFGIFLAKKIPRDIKIIGVAPPAKRSMVFNISTGSFILKINKNIDATKAIISGFFNIFTRSLAFIFL